jgi:hypothetical protein
MHVNTRDNQVLIPNGQGLVPENQGVPATHRRQFQQQLTAANNPEHTTIAKKIS